MGYMEPEALSFQPSGDFSAPKDTFAVQQYAKTGPSDAANDSYAAQRQLVSQLGRYGAQQTSQQSADAAQASRAAAARARAKALSRTPTPGALPTGFSSPSLPSTPLSDQTGSLFDEKPSKTTSLFDDTSGAGRLTFSQGTERVPGHGSGHVDTVPAMLAPGEAVLNRAAAESVGRGNIAQMNAAGAQQMGLGMRGSDEMRCYNEGTAYVDPNEAWGSRSSAPPAPAPQPGYAANFQPAPVMQPPAPDMRALGIGVAPQVSMTPPHIDHGPMVGIPNRPARMPAGPPAPPYQRMDPTGWADPGLAQRAPTAPMMSMPAPDMHIGWAPQGAAGDPNSPPMMHQMGLGMMPSRPNPSLGGERARGGMSAFEQAFAAARKSGQSEFPYKGGRYNTKLR